MMNFNYHQISTCMKHHISVQTIIRKPSDDSYKINVGKILFNY